MIEQRKRRNFKKGKTGWPLRIVVIVLVMTSAVIISVFSNKIPLKPKEDTGEKTEQEAPKEEVQKNPAEEKLNTMTLEEKVAQLFIVTPEQLTEVEEVTEAGEVFKTAITHYPVGGVALFSKNLISPEQVSTMNQTLEQYSKERIGMPLFISVDEEGGEVSRVAENENFGVEQFETMDVIGDRGKIEEAAALGNSMGDYLSKLGFNLDFAPVADVVFESGESYIETRSFGSDPVQVGKMVSEVIKGLHQHNIKTAVKHFPGLGSSYGDTHFESDTTEKTLAEMEATDFIAFKAAIEAGTDFVMVCAVSAPQVIGDETPSSLSKVMVTDVLRQKLGYHGLVVTDAMNMEAITQSYSSKEAAVMAINAGVDVVLMPEVFKEAYTGVIEAVRAGEIPEARINDSVLKVIELKSKL